MQKALAKLRKNLVPLYGRSEAEAIIRLIFLYLKNWNTTDILIHSDDTLSNYINSEIDNILQRLLKFEPIQYITGIARFHGHDFFIQPGVLIPRPETEQLVDIIVSDFSHKPDLDILDIGTGSGAIAISLAKALPFPDITAIDISKKAIETTEKNKKNLHARLNIIEEDVFNFKSSKQFDIIVSNPPYIPFSEKGEVDKNVLLYEPEDALFVPDDNPLKFYNKIIEIAAKSLKPSGCLYFEINPHYAEKISREMKENGFSDVQILLDSYGKKRFIKGSLEH